MVMKIYNEVVRQQFAMDTLDCQKLRRLSWRNTVFLDVMISLWYWLRRDLKEDLSKAE